MDQKGQEADRLARMRRRAEMQPSDSDHASEVSEDGSSRHEDWSEDEQEWEGQEQCRDERDGGESSTAESKRDEQGSIGERLERLANGVGPSRRKRNVGDAGKASDERHKGGGSNLGKRDSFKESRAKPRSRANKNRPQEVSSSRAVGRFREVVTGRRNTRRDPRFEGGGGSSKLNYDSFRKAYGFLGTYQDSEIEELKKSLRREKDQERAGRLQAILTRLQQERAERGQGDRRRTALSEVKKKEREAVAGGKKPFFLKGSEKKRLSLEQRYEGLKEEGKLAKFMEKKRKRNAANDHRWMPAKRQDRG